MNKKWMYVLVLAMLVVPLILTACGATPEPTKAPEAEPTKAPEVAPTKEPEAPPPAAEGPYENVDPTGQTVLWWHQHTKERQEGLNQMVEEFNETNEWGIEVVAEFAGGYGEIYDKMIAAISADDPTLLPNLTVGYANQVAKYQLAEALVDMDEFVYSPKWGLTEEEIADFPEGIFEADVSPLFGDGHFRMAFPPNRSMEVMYYNMDWLAELGYDGPPKTWAEFEEMACAATDADAGTVGYEISTDASRFASMVFSRQGSYFEEDGSAFDFTNDTVNETMTFMQGLYDKGCVTLIAERYGDQSDFGNYKTLFTIGSSSGLPYYDKAVKSGEQGEFAWSVAPLPYMDYGDEPVMNLYGASVTVPKTTLKQELAAWEFVKWFTEPEQNARWAKISNYFPVRKSAADSMTDYFDENPVYKEAFDLLPYSTYEAQWCACYEEVRRDMNNAYSSILDGADVGETLAQLQADANASLAENLPGAPPPQPKPTEAPEPPPAADMPSVEAADCDYGGKIKSIKALDPLTVQFEMCRPDPAFLSKAAFIPFAIWPSEYLEETGGTGDLLEKPIGTGPYYLDAWNRGESIVFKRFDDYWGDPAIAETMVLRWAAEGAARLLELQAGTVDQITNVPPDDYETVQNNADLQFLPRSNPNILYLAMCNLNDPFGDLKVRQAIAMGIDRQRIVENFYPDGSIVPTHFTPCSIPNGCVGDDWYDFDVEAARALLAEAGYPDGFETTIHYRDVFRGYLPEPGLVAVEFQSQLKENLGIDAEVIVMESGQFIDESTTCQLPGFYLLGWGADYPHVTNFLDFHFGRSTQQFGDPHPEIYEALEAGAQIGDPAEAEALYVEANNAIRELVPMVPIANGAEAQAARAGIKTHTRPFGASVYGPAVDTGTDTFVFMQNAEPISLYCGDESDGESLYACEMVLEPLLLYAMDSGDTVPALATSCEANEDSTVWTCYLREGVKFHDGSDFDAVDVIASWALGIDAANPLHVGNTGTFQYYTYLWDALMNADE